MRAFLCLLIFMVNSPLMAQTPAAAGKEISGVVRIIRAQPVTEVFFKDLKDSVIIPANSKHNQIYEACELSMKKGSAVKLLIDPVSRQALSIANPPAKDPAAPATPSPVDSAPSAEGSK